MAYPTVSGAYGFVPVRRSDGAPYAGAVTHYTIPDGDTTAIFKGDLLEIEVAGTVKRCEQTTTGSPTIIGVFLGCEYVDSSSGQLVHSNHYPGTSTTTNVRAYVCDDPNMLFKAAITSTADTPVTASGFALTDVGGNCDLQTYSAGSTANGLSVASIDDASATSAATRPLRVVQLVDETVLSDSTYVEALVRINLHSFGTATGI